MLTFDLCFGFCEKKDLALSKFFLILGLNFGNTYTEKVVPQKTWYQMVFMIKKYKTVPMTSID